MSSHHRLVCPHDCPDTCSMVITVDAGKAIGLRGNPEHSFTAGFLCHKVSRYLERVYHRERVLTPLERIGPKGAGQFRPISWDAAIARIADEFQRIRSSPDGPQAILPYSYAGTMGKIQGESLDRRFFHRMGASLLDRTICATAGGAGYLYTVGTKQGTDPEAFAESRYIINWGSNTAVTNSHLWVRMVQARKHGAKIVTIDPYRCRTAERSDWHLMPQVGTDAALALGLMHVLFRDRHIDEEYVSRYCLGTEQLRDRVLHDYSPQRVAQITGLSESDIEQLATEYATQSPAVIRINYGLQRHAGGGMAVRTIACLPALIGAWRHRAGGMLLSTSGTFPLNLARLQRPDLIPPGTRTINMVQLAEALHGGLSGPPVRAIYVYNSNPAAVAPDQNRVLSGFRRDDLFTVVHEQFLTDTTDYADIVLPATMQLEHFDLHTAYGHHDVQVNQPVIAPLGEAKSNTEVFRLLAKRMGLEAELFDITDEQLAREALWEFDENRPPTLAGITVERLRTEGPLRLKLPENYAPFAAGKFGTPSGKCEFFSQILADRGFDPLPTFLPAVESSEKSPQLSRRYPLQLLTPPSPHFLNSTFVNIDSLRHSAGQPELEIHPEDAAPREIVTGDRVQIQNDRGSFEAVAVVQPSVRPGVVVAPSIWWHKLTNGRGNANLTTSTRLTDFGGGATFFDNLVEVSRCDP